MKKLLILAFVTKAICLNAQDPVFTNIPQSLVYLNPSFAGSNGFIRNQTGYRNQWPQLSGSYVTSYNSYDMFFKKISAGIAFNYVHDDQSRGTLKTDIFNLTYAQYFYLCDKNLKIIPSLQAGGFIKRLDRSKLSFGEDYTQTGRTPWIIEEPPAPASKKTNIDFSAGLLTQYKHLFIGASVFHITQPDEGLYGVSKLPVRFNIHSSYNLITKNEQVINFLILYSHQAHFDYLRMQINSLLFKHLVLGGGYQTNNYLNCGLGYKHTYYSITLNYEQSFSNSLFHTWEINAAYYLKRKDARKEITNFENW